MNTTLSASQESPSKYRLAPNASDTPLPIPLPDNESLRRLSALDRLQVRLAIWLLSRTPITSAPRNVSADDAADQARERAARRARVSAHRAVRRAYETQHHLRSAAHSRTL